MLITARMFADSMKNNLIESRIPENCDVGYDSVQVIFNDDICLEARHAYIIEGKLLCKLTEIDPSCLIICTLVQNIDMPCSVLICQGSLGEIYRAALDTVNLYSKLEQELNEGLLREKEPRYFVEVCARFFGNLIQLLDPAFNVIAGLSPIYEDDGSKFSGFEKKDNVFSASLVNEMSKRNLLRETYEFKSAQYYKTPLFAYGSIQLNLFEEEKYLGKLLFIENNTPFTPGVADAVNIIGKYFKHLMIKRKSSLNASLFTAEYFISEILSGRVNDAQFISSQLSNIGWDIYDPYIVLYVQLDSGDISGYYEQSLTRIINDAIVFPFEGGVVAVIRMKDMNIKAVEQKTLVFLQESNLYAGLSEIFRDFLYINAFFIQAKDVVPLGMKTNLKQNLYHYRDYAIKHFVSAAVAMNYAGAFIHPAFQAIMAYDIENDTDFLKTLKVYLDSGTNQVLTAKLLHIHRNTLKYRLSRLKEIWNINLEDTNQRLRLILSFLLSEFMEKEKYASLYDEIGFRN